MSEETKKCSKCGEEKPIDGGFYWNKERNSYKSECKDCGRQRTNQNKWITRKQLEKNGQMACTKCGKVKDIEEFAWRIQGEARQPNCRKCANEITMRCREKKKEEYRAKQREYKRRVRNGELNPQPRKPDVISAKVADPAEETTTDYEPDFYGEGYSDGVREFAMAVIPIMGAKRREVLILAKEFGAKITTV